MTVFDSERFCQDHRIEYWPAGSKNVPKNHIGLRCPFCGDRSNHLHFRLGRGAKGAACWRCGWHRLYDVVAAVLRVTHAEAETIAQRYLKASDAEIRSLPDTPAKIIPPDGPLEFPSGAGPLAPAHRAYLESRGLNPYETERLWRLLGTDHSDPQYRWRIVAPIFYRGEAVSYQARDITGRQSPPYRAAPPAKELRPHKHCLYGAELARWDIAVVVEGVVDAWKLGPGAVALFGAKWTPAQALALLEFRKVLLLLDPEDAAGRQGAASLCRYLRGMGHPYVEDLRLQGAEDPGALSAGEARWLMERELKARKR